MKANPIAIGISNPGAQGYRAAPVLVPANGGAAINLTHSADESETAPLFSADSKTIAFSQRLKTEPSNNIAVLDLATRTVRVLTNEKDPEMNWAAVAFTKDNRHLIANQSRVGATAAAIAVDRGHHHEAA